MNPNDLMQQQQALANQFLQNQQALMWGVIIFQITFLLIGAWVVYMFYARLSDIADELRKIRVAYKSTIDREEDRRERFEALAAQPPANPFAKPSDDGKYAPKA